MICPECAMAFDCTSGHADAHECYACYYRAAMAAAEERFRPLTSALARRLEIQPFVEQTGGMVMCLAVPIGEKNVDGWHPRHVWFSEWDWADGDRHDGAAFGLYDFDKTDDGQVGWASNPAIEYEPENAEAIADWAAPLILAFAVDERPAGVEWYG